MMNLSAAILAGGKSSRMGTTKAFVEVHSCRIIDHAIDELKQVSNDIMIVTNSVEEYSHLGIRLVKDIVPGLGPLSGIHSALVHAEMPQVLIVACDMPFIEAQLANLLAKYSLHYDVVIPRVEGYFEPLFAVYNKSCIQHIEKCIGQGGKLRVVDFFSYVKVKYVNEDEISQVADLERVFYNVNTPKELALAKKLAEGK
ncbi:molybdenum cofactor guanylyltransferase [Peptococcaceae bacterium 1198_IL3148]